MTDDAVTLDDLDDLQLGLEAVWQHIADLDEKHAVVRAAEQEWRAVLQARTALVFRNNVGEIARVPLELAHLIATKGRVDCDVIENEKTIAFVRADETLAEIPKSLFAVLEQVLESWPWPTQKRRSRSRDSHRNPGSVPKQDHPVPTDETR